MSPDDSPDGSAQRQMTDEIVGRRRELTFRRYRLTVESGPDAGAAADGDRRELTCGTAAGLGLTLQDPTVSRHHFSIAAGRKGFLLRDLRSTNGTTLGGFLVEAAWLEPGARIGAGRSLLRFELADGVVREPLSDEDRWSRLYGASDAMRRLFAVLPRIAASDSTVLLEGETGTGKGLLAEAIHQASPRGKGPFVVVDCGAIPPNLIESELFGHEKGAFTGAVDKHVGSFESAQRGTLFLDEIGELPLELQPKLLRALEERKVRRVGGTQPILLDVRVIAATNRNLHDEVNRGAFRSDLYYRLDILRLTIPPLRERREDVPLLAAHFWEQFAPGAGPPPDALLARLAAREFPGNVRELRSAVERTALLGDPQLWDPPARSDAFDPKVSFRVAKERAVAGWESAWVGELVQRAGGNLSAAARAARMDRNYLRELLRKHKLAAVDE